jgi:TRAP-type C4-dicarboxylate transport system substrate-binding protein
VTAVLLATFAAAGAASAQEITLSAVVFVPRNTTFGEIFVRFVEQANKDGRGLVQINLRGGPDAIPTFEQGNALRTGVVDMVSIPPTFYTNVCPECDAQILAPQMTPQLRRTSFWTALQKYHGQKLNAHLLSAYGDGIGFHIWTSKSPSGGLKGMRLRTTPNYTPLFTALGVSLVTTAPGEVLTALERGVVDGYGWPAIGMFDLGWGAHTKYRVDPGFYNAEVSLVMNLDKYKSLTPAQRDYLDRKALAYENQNDFWKKYNQEEAARQKQAGIETISFDAATSRAYVEKAKEIGWANAIKASPQYGPELRKVLSR